LRAEEWRFLPGTEAYAVSSHGRFKTFLLKGSKYGTRVVDGRLVDPFFAEHGGYPMVSLTYGGKPARPWGIHVLVALAFLGPRPEGTQVCHNDGNVLNSHVENLRYDTPTGNSLDREAHGTLPAKDRHWNTRLTPEIVSEIRRLGALPGANHSQISRDFGLSRDYAGQIIKRRVWK
jgi:hypothetical protein